MHSTSIFFNKKEKKKKCNDFKNIDINACTIQYNLYKEKTKNSNLFFPYFLVYINFFFFLRFIYETIYYSSYKNDFFFLL